MLLASEQSQRSSRLSHWKSYKGNSAEVVDVKHLSPLGNVAFGYCGHTEHCAMIDYETIKLAKILNGCIYGFLCNGEVVEIASKGSDLLRIRGA